MTRLFVAAWPDAETVEQLSSFDWPVAPDIRRVPDRNLHITLRFLGDVDPRAATDLLSTATLPVATATLGPSVERLDGRQIVVPVAGVDPLAAAVRSATAAIGQHDPRPFRGHITIARTRRGEPSTIVEAPVLGTFRIAEVALVASDLQPTGAVYSTLATFSTTPR